MCYNSQVVRHAVLAQLDRVTGYEPVGQGFESLTTRQKAPFGCFLFLSRTDKTAHIIS